MQRLTSNSAHIPMPVTIIGSMNEHKANFATAAWICRVNGQPPMLGVALNRTHLTCKNIKRNKVFSVNILGEKKIREIDHCGIVSGLDVDKSCVFKHFHHNSEKSPLIDGAALSFDCKLVEVVKLPTHEFFIGEVDSTWADESTITNSGTINFESIAPIFLSMPDNRYWSLGEVLGKAWSQLNRTLD